MTQRGVDAKYRINAPSLFDHSAFMSGHFTLSAVICTMRNVFGQNVTGISWKYISSSNYEQGKCQIISEHGFTSLLAAFRLGSFARPCDCVDDHASAVRYRQRPMLDRRPSRAAVDRRAALLAPPPMLMGRRRVLPLLLLQPLMAHLLHLSLDEINK